MDTAVSSKTGRRRGATKENILYVSSTEEQRSRRPVFDETLRAEVFLSLYFVAPRSQILGDMLPRRSAHKAKNPLSGGVHSFLSGCLTAKFVGPGAGFLTKLGFKR
jgi:hypothetical protein